MIRVADYIFKYLADYGIKHVFVIVGGGSMILNDALRLQSKIKSIFNHHEQASAIAAEGYSRVTNKLSVVSVTSGPGGTNTITGVLGQWLDSIPVLYLSGQVKFETTIASCPEIKLRQLGDQEINIVDIVTPITKYATMITNPNSIKIELEKAITYATSGRPGPVWIDIPLSIQGALIDEKKLESWTRQIESFVSISNIPYDIEGILNFHKRPLIVAGHGIRLSESQGLFQQLVDKLSIPVVTTFNGFDLIPSDHPCYIGRIGTIGTRAGNFALQNADLIFFLGTRNNIRQISYNWKSFAKNAYKVIVDIDQNELCKPTIKGDLTIQDNVYNFIKTFLNTSLEYTCDTQWLKWCYDRKKKYSVVLKEYKDSYAINPYYFIDKLTQKLKGNEIVVAGNGTACVSLFQAGRVKQNQRMFWNSGCASMGYDLPAAIGACLASGKDIICIAGDGSIMMNLQELQTIKNYNLSIKIFILNNRGYRSIVQTQDNCFEGKHIGCDEKSGIIFPNFLKLAKAFGIRYFRINSTTEIDNQINNVLSYKGGLICEVLLSKDYIFQPKLSTIKKENGTIESPSLENMFPFLSEEELKSNIIGEDNV